MREGGWRDEGGCEEDGEMKEGVMKMERDEGGRV